MNARIFIFATFFLIIGAAGFTRGEFVRRSSFSSESGGHHQHEPEVHLGGSYSGHDDHHGAAAAGEATDDEAGDTTPGFLTTPAKLIVTTATSISNGAAGEDDADSSSEEEPVVTRRPKSKKHKSKSKGRRPEVQRSSGVEPEVETKNGRVRGDLKVVKVFEGDVSATPVEKEVYTFLGIPFAKSPVGDLRFRRPVPKGKWEGVWNATTLPNSCAQNPHLNFPSFRGEAMWNPNTFVSEDCLYLNIWIPASVFQNRGGAASATVLFWIHGGGFYSGTSTLTIYDGAVLAAQKDVIVVSTQYRLGPLGFMYFGHEEIPGNMGLLDQNLALQWTADNVGAFGGNPSDVTLFGESAGAACVSYHLLSPLSRSLFKRAVIMSGIATAPWAFRTKADALDSSYKIAKEVGCWSEGSRSDVGQVMECLRKAYHQHFVNAQFTHVTNFLEFGFAPTIDDYFLLDAPKNLAQSWDTKKSDILIGTVADEGTYFSVYKFPKYFNREDSAPISYDVFISTIREIFKGRPNYERDAIIAKYTNWKNLEDEAANQKLIAEAIGDAFFVCPLKDFGQKWAGRGLNVYYYSFTQRSSTNPWPEWMGVLHADEIEYAFGQVTASVSPIRPQAEVNLSLKFMELIVNFAKTGTPTQSWEKYSPEHQTYLDLNATVIADHSTRNLFGPRASKCGFWNHYLPGLRKTFESNCGAGGVTKRSSSAASSSSNQFSRIWDKMAGHSAAQTVRGNYGY